MINGHFAAVLTCFCRCRPPFSVRCSGSLAPSDGERVRVRGPVTLRFLRFRLCASASLRFNLHLNPCPSVVDLGFLSGFGFRLPTKILLRCHACLPSVWSLSRIRTPTKGPSLLICHGCQGCLPSSQVGEGGASAECRVRAEWVARATRPSSHATRGRLPLPHSMFSVLPRQLVAPKPCAKAGRCSPPNS
jgi:hypothetical protein